MEELVTIISFFHLHEAHIVKGKLESEGIEVFLKDEMIVQVNNLYSNAVGGIKLEVKKSDYDEAYQILVETGYLKEENIKPFPIIEKIDTFTSTLPLIGNLRFEMRLILFVLFLLTIIIAPFILISLS